MAIGTIVAPLLRLGRSRPGPSDDPVFSTLNEVAAGIFALDSGHHIVGANRVAGQLTGYPAESLIGRRFETLTLAADRSMDEVAFAQLGRSQSAKSLTAEKRIVHRQGHDLWVSQVVARGEQRASFVVTMLDISERKAREWRLVEESLMLRSSLALANAGAAVWSLADDVLRWDRALCRMFGRQEGEGPTTEAELLAVVHPDDRQRVATTLRETRDSGVDFGDFQYRGLRPNGTSFPVRCQVTVVRDRDGVATTVISVCQDLTTQRTLTASRQELAEAAKRSDELRTNFLANINHELRTPIAVILGFGEQLLAKPFPTPVRHSFIEAIVRNGRQLLEKVDALITLAQADDVGQPLDFVPVETRTFLAARLDEIRVRAEAKGVTVALDVDPGVPPRIFTDEQVLRRSLVGLLDNAVKFTAAGEVTLAAHAAGGKLEILVTDTGIGIPERLHRQVFQPFAQVDGSTTRLYGGCGFGLALARRLVSNMGGNLTLERSAEGEGSAFAVRLPLRIPE